MSDHNGTSAPTEQGWHWHWDGEVFRMLFVFPRPGHSYLAVQEETGSGKRHFSMASKMGGQWFGPINPPNLQTPNHRHSGGDGEARGGVIGYVGLITPSQRGAPDDVTIVVHTKIRHLEGLGDKLLSGPVMISAIDAARAGERG